MEVLCDVLSQLRCHECGELNLYCLWIGIERNAPQLCVYCVKTVIGNFHFTSPSNKERASR